MASQGLLFQSPITEQEEYKYDYRATHPHRKHSVQNSSPHPGTTNKNVTEVNNNKEMRTFTEIDEYLQHYVPPYIDSIALLKSFSFLGFFIFNIYFILERFVSLHTNSTESKHAQNYLSVSNYIVVYMDFLGLSVFIITLFISICVCSKSSIINSIIHIKSWYAFKLVYKFSPNKLLDSLATCYKHQKDVDSELNGTLQILTLKYILTQLSNQYNDIIAQLNQNIKEKENNVKPKMQSTHILKKYWNARVGNGEDEIIQRATDCAAWIVLIVIYSSLLMVGIMALALKLSQFSFLTQKDVLAFSGSDIYVLLAFCNQIWSAMNEDQIRTNTLYQCMFLDSIRCKYSKSVAHKIYKIDSMIKNNLWKYHGLQGFLMSFTLNWKFIFKLVFKEHDDIVTISDNEKYEHLYPEIKQIQLDHYSKPKGGLQTIRYRINQWKIKLGWKMRLQSKWKPLHPYTHCKIILDTINDIKQHSNANVWSIKTVSILKLFKKWLILSIPVSFLLQSVMGIIAFSMRHNEMKTLDKTVNKSDNHFKLYNMMLWHICFTGSMFVLIAVNPILVDYFCNRWSKCHFCAPMKCLYFLWLFVLAIGLVGEFLLNLYICGDSFRYLNITVSLPLRLFFVSLYVHCGTLCFWMLIMLLIYMDVFLAILLNCVVWIVFEFGGIMFLVGAIIQIVYISSILDTCSLAFTHFYIIFMATVTVLTFICGIFYVGNISKIYKSWENWYRNSWNVLKIDTETILPVVNKRIIDMVVVIEILFLLTHAIYAMICRILQRYETEQNCRRSLSGIGNVTVSCYLFPNVILLLWLVVRAGHIKNDLFILIQLCRCV